MWQCEPQEEAEEMLEEERQEERGQSHNCHQEKQKESAYACFFGIYQSTK
jgi:hypothetical protein